MPGDWTGLNVFLLEENLGPFAETDVQGIFCIDRSLDEEGGSTVHI